jgi:CheY-like chemotaxis protein
VAGAGQPPLNQPLGSLQQAFNSLSNHSKTQNTAKIKIYAAFQGENMIGEPVLVMLIEDNIDHAELVMRTLEEHRIANTVRHFLDGQTALDYLFHRGEFSDLTETQLPHIILLDLRLPRVDGIDVLRAIKEDADLKSIPVVVLTTSEAEKDVAKAYYNHANSYLVKPVGFEDFKKLMDDLGFYWLGWNVNPRVRE